MRHTARTRIRHGIDSVWNAAIGRKVGAERIRKYVVPARHVVMGADRSA